MSEKKQGSKSTIEEKQFSQKKSLEEFEISKNELPCLSKITNGMVYVAEW